MSIVSRKGEDAGSPSNGHDPADALDPETRVVFERVFRRLRKLHEKLAKL